MKHDESVYLKHVLDAVLKIEDYTKDCSEKKFLQNSLVQDGVIRQLEIIGEAVKRVSPELKAQHDNIPWQDIAGMRDKLIHGYFGVDIETIWMTIVEDIPTLKKDIRKIIKQIEK